MRTLALRSALALALLGDAAAAQTDSRQAAIDSFITRQMARRAIPGLSLAIVQDGRIVMSKGYGVVEGGGTAPVTTATLFQAGSISKSVAAAGALRLVEQGKLSLDGDVNSTLRSWKLPASSFTATKPVTLRGLLSHSAGLTVHGFPGYAVTAPVPSLVQVLDGAPPTNTPPIRVDVEPGSIWRYSGGGYTVMQQMVLDVTGQSFPEFMRQAVLTPAGMTSSSFEQPLPEALAARTATAHSNRRVPVPGRWHVYPEMAAAGLWTTASDLTRFAMEIQRSFAGKSSAVISPATAKQMLTDQKSSDGLGVFLHGSGHTLWFEHGGRDEGFDALLNATAETGQAAAVMINTNDNSRMMTRILQFIAREYRWPSASTYTAPKATIVRSAAQLRELAGRYELSNNNMISFSASDGRLVSMSDGFPDEEFIAIGDDRFVSLDQDSRMTFVRDASGSVTGMTLVFDGKERNVPRIGPPMSQVATQPDPDPGYTAKVLSVLRAMERGGQEVASAAALTAGAQRDFSQVGPWQPAVGLREIGFIAEQSVAGRGLERHDSPVDRIRYYRLSTEKGSRSLLVWITKEGAITDFDAVDE